MGYHTDFSGHVTVTPPLNAQEVEFLQKFNDTRRMLRRNGPYFVDGEGFRGQSHDSDILDFNRPPHGQPGLWCKWRVSNDGTRIEWDGGEKFYDSPEWMKYIIEHFLAPGAIAKSELPFLQANHIVSGTIEAQGEESRDRWDLVVRDNRVFVRNYEVTPAAGDLEPV